MKQERSFPQMFVTSKAEASIRRGHPWVYHTEITDIQGNCADGALADVLTQKGRYLGTGFFNSHSKIRVRIISTNSNDRFDMSAACATPGNTARPLWERMSPAAA